MENLSDIEIMDSILNGETVLFSILVDRYKNMAFTIAYRITGVREDAEEIVQDAFLKVFKGLAGFKRNARFSTWLYRIVYNTAVSMKRTKNIPMQPLDETQGSFTENDGNDDFEADDKKKMVEKMFSCLSSEEKVILTLFYLNESGLEEIKSVTGLSKANIKVKLFRSRKKIKEYMAGFPEFVYA
jgi:RNA polymerase sigma factor (sigma-70 family)